MEFTLKVAPVYKTQLSGELGSIEKGKHSFEFNQGQPIHYYCEGTQKPLESAPPTILKAMAEMANNLGWLQSILP